MLGDQRRQRREVLLLAAAVLALAAVCFPVCAADAPLLRPKAGKVEIMPLSEVKAGMKSTSGDFLRTSLML